LNINIQTQIFLNLKAMKKLLLSIVSLGISMMLQASVTMTFHVDTAGTLQQHYPVIAVYNVTNLTVTGNINSVDIAYIDALSSIDTLDLSGTTIVAFTGTGGTLVSSDIYVANQIPSGSFAGLNSLKLVKIAANVTSLADESFSRCNGFVSIDPNNQNFVSTDGVVFSKDLTKLYHYSKTKTETSYTIPSTVITINPYAFAGVPILTTMNIPSSVTQIAANAFDSCPDLISISIPSTITFLGYDTFTNCTSLTSIYAHRTSALLFGGNSGSVFYGDNFNTCTLYVPVGSKSSYQNALQWKDFTNIKEFIEFSNSTNSQTVTVTSTGKWSVSSDAAWLTLSPASGNGNGSFVVSAQPNTTSTSRTGTITITSDSSATLKAQTVQTITVIQDAGTTTLVPEVSETGNNRSTFSSLYEQNAILNFTYNMTGNQTGIVRLFNLQGQQLKQDVVSSVSGQNKGSLNVESLPTGIYFLSAYFVNGMVISGKVLLR
jgi:hypothetical protein